MNVKSQLPPFYAFGERWGPEPGSKDKYFGFLPGNGIHDIHMNQGNSDRFVGDDGVYQDGGLLVHFPGQRFWTAVFLKFQSQAWHTDDKTGHRIAAPSPAPPPVSPGPPRRQGRQPRPSRMGSSALSRRSSTRRVHRKPKP